MEKWLSDVLRRGSVRMLTSLPVAAALPLDDWPGADGYSACWPDLFGNHLIFVARRGAGSTASVHLSREGWVKRRVEGGQVSETRLRPDERAFVALCWSSSSAVRHDREPMRALSRTADAAEVARWQAMVEEPEVLIALTAVTGWADCRCGARICRVDGHWCHPRVDGAPGSRKCRTAALERGEDADAAIAAGTLHATWSAEPI
ncbi:hypothetical protein JKP75_09720 [Blastococcus sp. TML/M2B]|uniref:hypothetical protein n=1 Tax=unclassified Blastococcus TaxID=2619396 RepID=UPI00190E10D2|nr:MULTISPECIES: hypothetical protein [unclassified Blastococcus]MBN1092810.1 hypothetical protein [Blastococcus sp. TML/M2B]MBN1097083.1 hypothetical protein [Blastococcus sp. TML/C7B]